MPSCCFQTFGVFLTLISFLSTSHAQTLVPVTGGDAGQGLTLNPAAVLYAYNANGTAATTVQGVAFAPLALGENYHPYNASLSAPFAGDQNSADDATLTSVLRSVAWDGGYDGLSVSFTGLTAHTNYLLNVLFYAGDFAEREQVVLANGGLVSILTLSRTEARVLSFTTAADATGKIELGLMRSGVYGGTGYQDGVLLNAVVLSSVIPEPSTYAAIFGIAVLSAVVWRRRVGGGFQR